MCLWGSLELPEVSDCGYNAIPSFYTVMLIHQSGLGKNMAALLIVPPSFLLSSPPLLTLSILLLSR